MYLTYSICMTMYLFVLTLQNEGLSLSFIFIFIFVFIMKAYIFIFYLQNSAFYLFFSVRESKKFWLMQSFPSANFAHSSLLWKCTTFDTVILLYYYIIILLYFYTVILFLCPGDNQYVRILDCDFSSSLCFT